MRSRIRPIVLTESVSAVIALQSIGDYAPHKTQFSATELLAIKTRMEQAQQAELLAQHALDAARDAARDMEWRLYDAVIGARTQVIAQYGSDSNEIASLGLKKKSERKRPTRVAIARSTLAPS